MDNFRHLSSQTASQSAVVARSPTFLRNRNKKIKRRKMNEVYGPPWSKSLFICIYCPIPSHSIKIIIIIFLSFFSNIQYQVILYLYNSLYLLEMQNLGGLFCSICLDYFVKPVITKCGHSFCEYCIEEYFLHF